MNYLNICQKNRHINNRLIQETCLEADASMDLSSCGHMMHERCFINFINTKNVDKMLKDSGAFLCPFCAVTNQAAFQC